MQMPSIAAITGGAAGKALPGADQDDGADGRVGLGARQGRPQQPSHVEIKAVDRRIVEP
jgi:hypothetical protein